MRIRSIKPEFWRDEGIVQLPVSTRLTFIGLWSYVDDNGVGDARVSSVVGDLYADDMSRDPTETLRRVSGDLQKLSDAGMIVRYTDPERPLRELLYIVKWTKHQVVNKPSKGNMYPLPPAETIEAAGRLQPHSGDSPETPPPGAGEQGSRGTGEQSSSSAKLPASAEPPREDVEALCTRLRDHVARNTDKPPTITTKWRTDARLLLDKDGIEFNEATRVMDWCQQDSFWMPNILSMPKFREKFAQLQIKSRQSAKPSGTRGSGYDPSDWLRPSTESAFDYIDAEVVQLREIGR